MGGQDPEAFSKEEDLAGTDRHSQIKDALVASFYRSITHRDEDLTTAIVSYAHFEQGMTVGEITECYQAAYDAKFKEEEEK